MVCALLLLATRTLPKLALVGLAASNVVWVLPPLLLPLNATSTQ
jgi:hypothetical protein